MEYEWDEAKRRSNLAKHGVDFAWVANGFEWTTALLEADVRRDYGEQRWLAISKIAERLYTIVYTNRNGRTRLISARKSKRQEVQAYENSIDSSDTRGRC